MQKIDNVIWEIEKKGNMNVPVRVIANDKIIEGMKRDRTFGQITNVAGLPGIIKNALVMPDGHEGYGFPIGGVAAFDANEGIISPGGIGFDINCGVRLVTTPLMFSDVEPKINELVKKLFENIPSGVGSKGKLRLNQNELFDAVTNGVSWAVEQGYGFKEDIEHCEENGQMKQADASYLSDTAIKRGKPQLGTLGAGNHFLEVQKVEQVFDPLSAEKFGLKQGQAVVMIHSGSRGFGHQICTDYLKVMLENNQKHNVKLPDLQLCYAHVNEKIGQEYISSMSCAVNYAFTNRQMMMHRVRQTFEQVFNDHGNISEDMHLVYDVAHNIAKFENHNVDGKNMDLIVHRKGATRAFPAGRPELPMSYRDIGQPVLIPGSMGTSSYVLAGEQKGMGISFGSTCHGAGRVMSRKQSIRDHPWEQVMNRLTAKGITLKAADEHIISEEAPEAYKDVDDVINSVVSAGITRKVAKMIPKGVVKG